jgi:hypothetical protein
MQSAAAAELSAALEMPAIARRAAAIGVEASSSSSSSSVDNESLTIAFDDDDNGSDKDKGRKSGGSDVSAATADPNDIFSKSWVRGACTCAHVLPIFLDQLIHRLLTNQHVDIKFIRRFLFIVCFSFS